MSVQREINGTRILAVRDGAALRLPDLLATAKNGRPRRWRAWVEGATVYREFGYDDGGRMSRSDYLAVAHNMGRSNEISAEDQALFEAHRHWRRKLREGFAPAADATGDTDAAEAADATGVTDEPEDVADTNPDETQAPRGPPRAPPELLVRPMLAHPYAKRSRHVRYPALAQPKLDGIRGLARLEPGAEPSAERVIIMSRGGHLQQHLNHIRRAPVPLFEIDPEFILDGELYSHELLQNEVSGICRHARAPSAEEHRVAFHIFDLAGSGQVEGADCATPPGSDEPFAERYQKLVVAFGLAGMNPIEGAVRLVRAVPFENPHDLVYLHQQFVEQGYEGIMVRNAGGPYAVGERSNDLLKFKSFHDDEFRIVGFDSGRGTEEKCVVWRCETPGGARFSCRPRGTLEQRRAWFARGDAFVGKQLTVRFQELSEEGIPLFPVGVGVRETKDADADCADAQSSGTRAADTNASLATGSPRATVTAVPP